MRQYYNWDAAGGLAAWAGLAAEARQYWLPLLASSCSVPHGVIQADFQCRPLHDLWVMPHRSAVPSRCHPARTQGPWAGRRGDRSVAHGAADALQEYSLPFGRSREFSQFVWPWTTCVPRLMKARKTAVRQAALSAAGCWTLKPGPHQTQQQIRIHSTIATRQ